MSQDNIYNQLKKLLENSGAKFNILEDQIDVELQVDFFEMVNKLLKDKRNAKDVITDGQKLFNSDLKIDDKKLLLAELSIVEDPEAYRLIEKFIELKDKELYQWAVLSLQHSRISLETHFLDEQQVFISTGLGGKGEKLRYFIVCKLKTEDEINDFQKKIIKTEFDISFNSHHSIIEKISFFNNYFSILGLIPIDVSINDVVKTAIRESNNYGGFLHEKFLVTNVKILKFNEIEGHFNKMGI